MLNLLRDQDNPFRRWYLALSLWGLAGAIGVSGCSAPRQDFSDPNGRDAVIEAINDALTIKDCATAISLVEPWYASTYTGNDARMLRAASHGCHLGINFFSLLGEIATTNLTGTAFWQAMAQFFPSTLGDGKTESSWYATDALQATVKPGTVFTPSLEINTTTTNVGSLVASDHTDDANIYLTLVSMGTIGTIEWRYGIPSATTFKKSVPLPWTAFDLVDTTGCSYVSAMLNILDALQAVQTSTQGSHLSQALSSVIILKTTLFDPGCTAGCVTCGLVCNGCAASLRTRTACQITTPATKSVENCAVAGLVSAINTDPTYGWLGP